MQLELTDNAQNSIATAAAQLTYHLHSETGDSYSPKQIEQILWRCLESVAEDWATDAYEHCTRPRPYGHSQNEFDRLLQRIRPAS